MAVVVNLHCDQKLIVILSETSFTHNMQEVSTPWSLVLLNDWVCDEDIYQSTWDVHFNSQVCYVWISDLINTKPGTYIW